MTTGITNNYLDQQTWCHSWHASCYLSLLSSVNLVNFWCHSRVLLPLEPMLKIYKLPNQCYNRTTLSECSPFRCGQLLLLWGPLLSCVRKQSVLWTMAWHVYLVSDDVIRWLSIILHGHRLVLGYNSEWFWSRFSLFFHTQSASAWNAYQVGLNKNSSIMQTNSL